VDAWGSRERTLLLLPLKGTAKRKRRKTDMFEPKATAPHLDSTKAGNALTERNISA
jgi:hypothetical protein